MKLNTKATYIILDANTIAGSQRNVLTVIFSLGSMT